MGIWPVAPKSKRALLEGEKRVNGFTVKPSCEGYRRIEMTYITAFAQIMERMILSD
jgi:hypothetical protein